MRCRRPPPGTRQDMPSTASTGPAIGGMPPLKPKRRRRMNLHDTKWCPMRKGMLKKCTTTKYRQTNTKLPTSRSTATHTTIGNSTSVNNVALVAARRGSVAIGTRKVRLISTSTIVTLSSSTLVNVDRHAVVIHAIAMPPTLVRFEMCGISTLRGK